MIKDLKMRIEVIKGCLESNQKCIDSKKAKIDALQSIIDVNSNRINKLKEDITPKEWLLSLLTTELEICENELEKQERE